MKQRRMTAREFTWHRALAQDGEVAQAVREIVAAVRDRGDAAILAYTQAFDGVDLLADATEPAEPAELSDSSDSSASSEVSVLRVPTAMLETSWQRLEAPLQAALQAAAARIRTFHEAQRGSDIVVVGSAGETVGMVQRALSRVGVYAPGGRAAYPSTVLMNVIPAQVAGVRAIALASPPADGSVWPHPLVMAAAHMLGVTEVYRMGGAQAIAAFAYGTASVARVDKVVGPGNLYVALAKRAVMGDVGIDSLAGPSEVFIVADETVSPVYIAADLLAQAEHDPEAGAVCITTSADVADAVEVEIERQLLLLPKRDIAREALESWGAIVIVETLAEAFALVNACAPEHVEVLVQDAQQWLPQIETAGAVFLGPYTPEPVGDYYAGTNHVLPTHGSARFASGLGVADFVRRMSYVAYTEDVLMAHADHIVALAQAEGLHAHARSILVRRNGGAQL